MSDPNPTTRPNFSAKDAEVILLQQFGVMAETRPLPSYNDQNFHVIADNGRQFVLKISSLEDSRDDLMLQNGAMAHLQATVGDVCMKPIPTRDQQLITAITQNGHSYLVRLMTWVQGTPYAKMDTLSADFHYNVGRFVATMDRALSSFTHPASQRDTVWDLAQAKGIRPYVSAIDNPDKRAIVNRALHEYEQRVHSQLSILRQQIIHGDVNEYNVLCNGKVVTGIVDFGDVIQTAMVCEPAIAAAYATLNQPDPLLTAVHLISGYHSINPLSDKEFELLFNLIKMRLCISVTMSNYSAKLEPDNVYIPISAKPAWATLAIFDVIDPDVAHAALRSGAG